MLDQVARALHATLPRTATGDAAPAWDDLPEEARGDYRLAAYRAIAAMRVPSDPMLAEGARSDLSPDAANVWERMVFTALSELH